MTLATYNKYKFLLPVVILLGSLVFISIASPGFFSAGNILNVLEACAVIAIPAMGLAGIMIAGSFDLSFVGVIGLVSVVTIKFTGMGIPLAVVFAATFLLAMLCEAVNAFIIVRLKVHPWLTTIATMLMLLGLEQSISKGEYLALNHPFFEFIRFEDILWLPVSVLIMAATVAFFIFFYAKTKTGVHLYAVGGNLEAARKAGIKTDKLQALVFFIMGALSWIAALIYLSNLSGYPPESAYINQLEVILAVFFGMSISKKNVINMPGTLIGSIFVLLLSNGLGLMGVNSYWIKLIEGCLVIIVIIGNSLGREEIVEYE
ncbi:MAG: ABC transporter permease [Spirochaetota bacterium]